MAWTLDYLDDIASDLSRFHGIRDANTLEGPVFFTIARRLAVYGGMIAARLRTDADPPRPATPAPQRPTRQEAAPVTPALLRELNGQLGANTFSIAMVGPDA